MPKVLLIEDDENLRDVYIEQFQSEEFEIISAPDGEEGIAKMYSFNPDIVLLDILMPKLNGYEVLKKRMHDPKLKEIPVIVITNIFTNAQDMIMNWGASAVLLKVDNTPGDVVSKVRSLLKT